MIRLSLSVVVAVIALFPVLFTGPYIRQVAVLCGIYAIYAVSVDIIAGLIGLYSFGQAAFLGVGGYVAALLMMHFNAPLWAVLPASMLIAGLLGTILILPALRLRGVYFAIVTLACGEICRLVAINWTDLTRGVIGLPITVNAFPALPDSAQILAFYYLSYGLLAVACFFLYRFLKSPTGQAIIAVRENEMLAASVGVPILRLKSTLLIISAMLAGLAGAIYAPFVGIVSPDLLSVDYSAVGLLMVVVGGQGTIIGAIIGAFIFTGLTELLRFASELRMVIFSVALIISIIMMPKGIVAPFLAFLMRSRRVRSVHTNLPV